MFARPYTVIARVIGATGPAGGFLGFEVGRREYSLESDLSVIESGRDYEFQFWSPYRARGKDYSRRFIECGYSSICVDDSRELVAQGNRFLGETGSSVRDRIQKFALREDLDSSIDLDIRTRSLRLLRYADRSILEKEVVPLLEHADQAVVLAAMEACSVLQSREYDSWLVEQLGKGTNRLRAESFTKLRNDPSRLDFLLTNLEVENVSLRVLDASQMQSLQSIADEGLRSRATKLFENLVNKDRQKVLDEYAVALEDGADASRGRAVFVKNCSACHRIGEDGYAVGPDISDSRDQTLEKLLVAVLDPNRSVDANYFRYVAVTDDGQVMEGLLRDSTRETITLKGQNAKETVLRRDEISELKAVGTSLMPEGVESQITVSEMADLLAYIKNWRYLDGSIPK